MENFDKKRTIMNYNKGSEWNRWDLHVHTTASYDYKYKGTDADDLLCSALKDNNIVAVAITDHFLISSEKIMKLRKLAPNITFFPGVELRTDKGAKNLHLILIFSEKMDVKILSDDFDAIMRREKAKASDSDQTIHWTFDDIIEFAKKRNALITIHAGEKSNGIDEEITNALPVKEAIKEDIAKNIHFFEVGKTKDITAYYEHVFKDIDEKPIIMCSDCHDPRNYSSKENLWIKAKPTFEGLLQCLYQPKERVFVGAIPPVLDRERKNKRSNIARISAQRIPECKNIYNWLEFDIELNSGLIAIIGNKGSGKSALSDIIGHLCKCTTMDNASFLNEQRFRKAPSNYANDYEATITWGDLYSEKMLLSKSDYETTIENAQYLPQKYIENICNDVGGIFQDEIDKVVFSYVDKSERGTSRNLTELVKNKSTVIDIKIEKLHKEIDDINSGIIRFEEQKTKRYHKDVEDNLKKLNDNLDRHIKAKPTEIKKPAPKENDNDYQMKLEKINQEISTIEQTLADIHQKLTKTNECIDEINILIAKIESLEFDILEVNKIIQDFKGRYDMETIDIISTKTPKNFLKSYLENLINEKYQLNAQINGSSEETNDDAYKEGLIVKLENANKKKESLISTMDSEEKSYQKYISDYKEWENEKKRIEGDFLTENTLEYFKTELSFLENRLEPTYNDLRNKREEKIIELFNAKQELVSIYNQIYSPIKTEISKLLGDIDKNISFEAEIQLLDNNLAESLLEQINKAHVGVFKGKTESQNTMSRYIKETEFNKIDSILEFIKRVLKVIDEDIDNSSKKVTDKETFYRQICTLDYIGVTFRLKFYGRDLKELSPGERGIVLIIFYLALSNNSTPIIIDQPEDNLDNQSVYDKLVPCICAAKKKRQVIIVTHNPNIAIACDAEQIIFCKIDKSNNSIRYYSGAIEDEQTNNDVVNVLEGTMPAFDLRRKKYLKNN